MARRTLVVVGASAGGVEGLKTLVAGLDPDFPAAILVVLHVPAESSSALPAILRRCSRLDVRQAEPDDKLEPGTVLVAPPGWHLLVYDGRVTLSRGPLENGHRPAVDVLFRSAASVVGSQAVGVVLSGALDDGAAGLLALKSQGAATVVQDPADAQHPSMPRSAIHAADPDHVVACVELPALLTRLVTEDVEVAPPSPSGMMRVETTMAQVNAATSESFHVAGNASGFACPNCHGALFEVTDAELVRFRCRVGHAWSPESLLAQQHSAMEGALWMALRTLEEKAALSEQMGDSAADRGHQLSSRLLHARSQEAIEAARLLRGLLGGASGGPRPAGAESDAG